jgi:hypothetical protein
MYLLEGTMQIGIMNTAKVGSYFGGLLAQSGQNMTFIARCAPLVA